jgi:hypothetical protein
MADLKLLFTSEGDGELEPLLSALTSGGAKSENAMTRAESAAVLVLFTWLHFLEYAFIDQP